MTSKYKTSRSDPALEYKPILFDLALPQDIRAFKKLRSSRKIQHILDDYEEQEKELFAINNPARVYTPDFEGEFRQYLRNADRRMSRERRGRWAYFPWAATVSHILPDTDFQRVRTARNRDLISESEQKKFYDAKIGIGGLSVGNSVALAIVLQGGARHIKLADHDRLALSNINRVRSGAMDLGLPKVIVTARQIYALNPYAKVQLFPEGLTPGNIDRFFKGIDVMVDELDNLAVKFLIREKAHRYRIPVVMGADNGDNAVVDIERYDLNPRPPFFHGRMGKISYEQLTKLDKFGIGRLIARHIGAENVTERMQASLGRMGKTIVSWPQLGGAALLNGSAVAYCVRKITTGEPLESNRASVILDEKFVPGYSSQRQKQHRRKLAEEFSKKLNT